MTSWARYKERHPDRVRASQRRYYETHREKKALIDEKRKATRYASTDKWKAGVASAWATWKLEVGCADCGYAEVPDALELDHLPGFEKSFPASAGSHSLERLMEEAAKCEVVCANCHRIRTALRRRGDA